MFNKTSSFESIKTAVRYIMGNFHDLFTDTEIAEIANYCIKNCHNDLVPYLSLKLKNKVFEKDELLSRLGVGL